MNAFLDKRLAVLERRLFASREPLVIRVRGGLAEAEGTAIAFSPSAVCQEQDPPSSPGGYRSNVPTGLHAYLTWSQAPSESGERFRQRVLAEAGDCEIVVFSGQIG
jgi:hypothetical protein